MATTSKAADPSTATQTNPEPADTPVVEPQTDRTPNQTAAPAALEAAQAAAVAVPVTNIDNPEG